MTAAEPRFTRDLPEVRRRKLIEATAQCLAEFGHAGTSVRAVAAKANVSPGLVAHHFKGIDDLIVATYDHVGAQVAEALNAAIDTAPDDAEAKLRAFIEASFKPPVLDRDLLAIWLSFWSLVRRDPGVRKVHKKVYADYRRRLEDLIAEIARGAPLQDRRPPGGARLHRHAGRLVAGAVPRSHDLLTRGCAAHRPCLGRRPGRRRLPRPDAQAALASLPRCSSRNS